MINRARVGVPCGNELGEAILWDDLAGLFCWTDIQARKLWSSRSDGSQLVSHELPARLTSFALTDQPGVILAAFDRGIATYSIAERCIHWISHPLFPQGVRFNDGRVDRSGRFVVGTMVEDCETAGGTNLGALYRVEADGSLSELLSGIAISNALCFSVDGSELYHADTPTRRLFAYSYETGECRSPRLVREFPEGEGPDGACVDADGNIWVAIWGGSRVECLSPNGETLHLVQVDAVQPTCPGFGGAELTTLAITSAWEGLAQCPESRPRYAGDLFLVDAGVQGLPESRVILT